MRPAGRSSVLLRGKGVGQGEDDLGVGHDGRVDEASPLVDDRVAAVGYSEFGPKLAERPEARGWVVLDKRIHDLCLPFTGFRQTVESGALVWADSLADLAAAGISGHGASGYLAGNGLLSALGPAYLAATHAVSE